MGAAPELSADDSRPCVQMNSMSLPSVHEGSGSSSQVEGNSQHDERFVASEKESETPLAFSGVLGGNSVREAGLEANTNHASIISVADSSSSSALKSNVSTNHTNVFFQHG